MQIEKLKKDFDILHKKHGDKSLCSIYGAGCTKRPKAMFVFMNPTGKNVSATLEWRGMRAPWLGSKPVWRFFYDLGFLSGAIFEKVHTMKSFEWNEDFSFSLYKDVAGRGGFITNLAKCTQIDARPLPNNVFVDYLPSIFEEIATVLPQNIFTFGNQVSSVLLGKNLSVGDYKNKEKEILVIGKKQFDVYPTWYPVGQGTRNMPLAIARVKKILG